MTIKLCTYSNSLSIILRLCEANHSAAVFDPLFTSAPLILSPDQHIDDEDHLISQDFEDSFVPQPGTTGSAAKTENPVSKPTQVKEEPDSSSEDRRVTRTVGTTNAHGQAFVKAWMEAKKNSEREIRRGIKRKEAPDSGSVALQSPKK